MSTIPAVQHLLEMCVVDRLETLRATHRCFAAILQETDRLGLVYPGDGGSTSKGAVVLGRLNFLELRGDNDVYRESLDELTTLLLQDAPLQYSGQQRDALQLAMLYGILGPGWDTRKTDARVLYAQHHFDTGRLSALKGADWLTTAVLETHDVVEDHVKQVMKQRFSREKPGKSLHDLPEAEQRVYMRQTKELIQEWLEAIASDFRDNIKEDPEFYRDCGYEDYDAHEVPRALLQTMREVNRGIKALPYVLDLMTRPWHADYFTYFLRLYNTSRRWDGLAQGDNVDPEYLYALDRRGYTSFVFERAQMAKPLDRADNTATLLGYGLPPGVQLYTPPDAQDHRRANKIKPFAPARQVLNGFKNLVFLTEALQHYAPRIPTEAQSIVDLDPEGPYYRELLRVTKEALSAFVTSASGNLGLLGFVRRPVYHHTLREYEARGGLDQLTDPGETLFPWWRPLEARIGRYFDARVVAYAVLARDIARETPSTSNTRQLYKDAIVFLRMAEKIEEERFYRPRLYVPREVTIAHLRSKQF
ncbi:hypothetical protein HYW21_06010 [Candidatus Woesearchaeota archaeon]|nr:hypothetical protein [Candidatus Woesearchaeota archaeon]